MAATGKLPWDLLSYVQSKGTLNSSFNGISSTSPWWPTHGRANEKLYSWQTPAMNAAEGDCDVLLKALLSLLVAPKTMLKRNDQSWAGLVLATQQDRDHTGAGLLEPWEAGSIVFDIIADHKDWKEMKIDTYTPTDPSQQELSRVTFVCVDVASKHHCWSSASNWASVGRGAECSVQIRGETEDGGSGLAGNSEFVLQECWRDSMLKELIALGARKNLMR